MNQFVCKYSPGPIVFLHERIWALWLIQACGLHWIMFGIICNHQNEWCRHKTPKTIILLKPLPHLNVTNRQVQTDSSYWNNLKKSFKHSSISDIKASSLSHHTDFLTLFSADVWRVMMESAVGSRLWGQWKMSPPRPTMLSWCRRS